MSKPRFNYDLDLTYKIGNQIYEFQRNWHSNVQLRAGDHVSVSGELDMLRGAAVAKVIWELTDDVAYVTFETQVVDDVTIEELRAFLAEAGWSW